LEFLARGGYHGSLRRDKAIRVVTEVFRAHINVAVLDPPAMGV
jgi:hypothetical protein